MNYSEFRKHYEKYTNFPILREIWDTEEGSAWDDHLLSCPFCSDWHLQQQVHKRGDSVDNYPCVHMAYHATFTCEEHPNLDTCSKAVIFYNLKLGDVRLNACNR